jgi:hypothetical protein
VFPSKEDPILNILGAAYPDGLPKEDYWPLVATLLQYMSNRGMTETMRDMGYADYVHALASAYMEAVDDQTEADIERIKAKLRPFGFDKWATEP